VTADTSLWTRAACAGLYDLYELADTGDRQAQRDCLALCHSCPVIAECLEATLRYEAKPGAAVTLICGGLTAAERAKLLGKRRPSDYMKTWKANASTDTPECAERRDALNADMEGHGRPRRVAT